VSSGRRSGSVWPSETQRALLEVVLGPAEEAAARWQALQPLDVTALDTGSFGLLPLLYERLQDAAPGDARLPRLFGTYRSIWYRNQLLLDRAAVLLPLLRQRAHVEPLLVGGTSALLRWYPRLGLRPVPQLELVVEPEAAAAAVKVAGYAGWRPAQQGHAFTRLRDESGRVLLIHHGLPLSVAGPLRGEGLRLLRERALALSEVEGLPLVLDPGDELMFVCASGARTTAVPTCQWLIDVHHLLESGRLPAAAEVVDRARRFHLVVSLRATLAYLAELCGSDLSGELLRRLDEEQTSRRDRAAFRLAGVGGRRSVPVAQALAVHLRATAEDPLYRVVTRLPRTLQESWGARNLFEVSALSLRKTARLFGSEGQPAASVRNDSASS
jgi:hypothetical protein